MKLRFDQKTLQVKIDLTEEDLQEALEIKKMMMSEGWKILESKYQLGKQLILDKLKKDILDVGKKELSSIHAAIYSGFDQCSNMAKDIVLDADIFIRQLEEKRKEVGKDGTHDEE